MLQCGRRGQGPTKAESESISRRRRGAQALHNNEALFETFGDTTLATATATNGAGAFNPDRDGDGEPDGLECGGCGGLYGQFTTVARLLKMGREVLGSERDAFYTQRGAWDTHNTLDEDVSGKIQDVDQSSEALVAELRPRTPEGHDDRGPVGLWSDLNLERQGHGPRLGRQHVRARGRRWSCVEIAL